MDAKGLELDMLEQPSRDLDHPGARANPRLSLADLDAAGAASAPVASQALAGWVRGYLMRPHPDLGRTGHVCPFTAQAARMALLKIGLSQLGAADAPAILATMNDALRAFDALPCRRATRLFRTVIVGFPNCTDEAGIATLRRVQNALRHHSIVGAKMIGLFEPNSQAEGLINRDFRPLRAPVPALAIRMLVEQDAPFVRRNPLLVPVYLMKFPLAGPRRLMGEVYRARKVSAVA